MNETFRAAVLKLDHVARRYAEGEGTLEIFRDVSAQFVPGELVALVGPSGAGKSSLLHMAGLLEKPSAGDVLVNGQAASKLPDRERTQLRRDTIGFVYQAHHLLPEFDALENVMLPQMIANRPRRQAAERARSLLEVFGLGPRVGHLPGKLSGGEQQRVAIARALANAPAVLLADEPTGVAALVATHNPDLAARMDRTVTLREGRVVALA